jgi:phosphatidate cytidylyltransferase
MTGFIFGVVCALIGLLGDLSASALKRDAGIKDSGSLLPGLGGLVDTLDSLLLVGPIAWLMLG